MIFCVEELEHAYVTLMCGFDNLPGEGVLGRMRRGRGGVPRWMVRGLLASPVMYGNASGLGEKNVDPAGDLSMSVPGPRAKMTQGVLRRPEKSRVAGEDDKRSHSVV